MEVGAGVGEGASGRRRYWTAEEKRRIVELTLSSSQSVASLARQHGVNANQVFYWRKLYRAGQLGGESAADASGVRLLPVSVGNEEPSDTEASETERDTHESAEPPLTRRASAFAAPTRFFVAMRESRRSKRQSSPASPR